LGEVAIDIVHYVRGQLIIYKNKEERLLKQDPDRIKSDSKTPMTEDGIAGEHLMDKLKW
jgi:hypothetical protein